MEAGANEISADAIQASYSVITLPARKLPRQYENMILARWKRSLRFGNEYFKLIDQKAYFDAYEVYIKHLLNKEDAVLRLAVLSEDHDVVFGWSLCEGDILHYIHVQDTYRNKPDQKLDISKNLIPSHIKCITHLTKKGAALWAKKYPHWIFNPFAKGES